MNNAFDGLICRVDIIKKRITELEDTLMETSKTEMQTEKRMKKMEQNSGIITIGVLNMHWEYQNEKKQKGQREKEQDS